MQQIKSIKRKAKIIKPSSGTTFTNASSIDQEVISNNNLITPNISETKDDESLLIIQNEKTKDETVFSKNPKTSKNIFWKRFVFCFLLFVTLNVLIFFRFTQTFLFNQYISNLNNNISTNEKKINTTNLNITSSINRFSINLLDRQENNCLEIANFKNLILFPKSERIIIEKDKSFIYNTDLLTIINQHYQELEKYNIQLSKIEQYNEEIKSTIIDNVTDLEKICNDLTKLSTNLNYIASDSPIIKSTLLSLKTLENKITNPELPNFVQFLKIIKTINSSQYGKVENYNLPVTNAKSQNKRLLVRDLRSMIRELLSFSEISDAYTKILNKPDFANTTKNTLLKKVEEINQKDFREYPLKVRI